MPEPSILVKVSVTLTLDNGLAITDSYEFHSISQEDANFREYICNLLSERLKPIPWWERDPEKLKTVLPDYSRNELLQAQQRIERISQNFKSLIDEISKVPKAKKYT